MCWTLRGSERMTKLSGEVVVVEEEEEEESLRWSSARCPYCAASAQWWYYPTEKVDYSLVLLQ